MSTSLEIFDAWFVLNDHKLQIELADIEQDNVFVSYRVKHLSLDYHLDFTVALMSPKFKEGKISIYVNSDKYLRGIRTLVKYGSFIKRIYPLASQKEVDVLIDSMKNFVENIKEAKFSYRYSDTAEDFKNVYSGEYAPQVNMHTSSHVKTISNSCMRYQYQDDAGFRGQHPAEAYATGDFEIHWIEDQDGLLYARCVAFKESPSLYKMGPIYAVANKYCGMLTEHIQEFFDKNEITFQLSAGSNYGWKGAKLKLLDHESADTIVAPYVDCGPRGAVLDESGDTYTLKIQYNDDIPIEVDYDLRNNGNGVAYKMHFICAGSGKRHLIDSDSVELDGEIYSFEYANENFHMCEVTRDWYRDDADLIKVSGSYLHKSFKDDLVMSNYSKVLLHPLMSSAYKIVNGEFNGDLVTYGDYMKNFRNCSSSMGYYHAEELVTMTIDKVISVHVCHHMALQYILYYINSRVDYDISRLSFTYGNLVPDEIIEEIEDRFAFVEKKQVKNFLRSKYDSVIKWITR